MPICLSAVPSPRLHQRTLPWSCFRGSHGEGALTWLPTPATEFPFHTKELFLHLWVKSFFGAMISPHSLWFCDISVQQSPQQFVLMAVAPAVAWGHGVSWLCQGDLQGCAQPGHSSTGSHSLITALLLVTRLLLLCDIKQHFSFPSLTEFMGI